MILTGTASGMLAAPVTGRPGPGPAAAGGDRRVGTTGPASRMLADTEYTCQVRPAPPAGRARPGGRRDSPLDSDGFMAPRAGYYDTTVSTSRFLAQAYS